MVYYGEIRQGIIVLNDAPPLREGTRVKVKVTKKKKKLRKGSAEAVLEALSRCGNSWAESAAEMDDALAYLNKTKWDDVARQQALPEPGL